MKERTKEILNQSGVNFEKEGKDIDGYLEQLVILAEKLSSN